MITYYSNKTEELSQSRRTAQLNQTGGPSTKGAQVETHDKSSWRSAWPEKRNQSIKPISPNTKSKRSPDACSLISLRSTTAKRGRRNLRNGKKRSLKNVSSNNLVQPHIEAPSSRNFRDEGSFRLSDVGSLNCSCDADELLSGTDAQLAVNILVVILELIFLDVQRGHDFLRGLAFQIEIVDGAFGRCQGTELRSKIGALFFDRLGSRLFGLCFSGGVVSSCAGAGICSVLTSVSRWISRHRSSRKSSLTM